MCSLALNAGSFCERGLSAGNLIMTKGNTLLSDEKVEMLIILRMNRHFMEFMRAEYPDVCKILASQHSLRKDGDHWGIE